LHEAWLDDQLRSRREPVEVDQLIMNIFRQGRSQLRAQRKDLRLIVTDLEPITVMGDPGQLRQAALILLDNAIKYTPAGGKIRISATRTGEMMALSIADTGIGIDPEDRPHIFERFYRADHARERDEHGSGLGLAIAKWIASAHRGDIQVDSQPGQGSTFTLLLPAIPSSARAADTHPSGAKMAAHTNGTHGGGIHAIYPLARLARSVSRPRAEGGKAKSEHERRSDAKAASTARAPKPKRGRRE
jgi:K+-sensing histidine kinase KdpD